MSEAFKEHEHLVVENEDLENDPFDLSEFHEPPNLRPNIVWDNVPDWNPALGSFKKDKNGKATFTGRVSDIAQAILYHLGRPLRLDNHAFLLPLFNDQDPKVVLKCSRQVAKSTTICNLQIVESAIIPHWRSLFVSPSAMQTRTYSNEKVRPTISDSPFIQNVFIGKGISDQVFEKTFLNGSYMFMRYAFLTAARARGIPASRVFFDEAQDLLKDNIKVISQSLSASRLASGYEGREMIAGTPLTFSNTLEEYWQWSTQNEWLVPCDCKIPRYWNMIGADNIGKKGLVCSNKKCGKPLNAASGQWVSFAPDETYVGYHVSQLMVPWKQKENAWKSEIVLPFEKWPDSKFNNEILGLSYDNASTPVTRMDIQANCYPHKQLPGKDTSEFSYRYLPEHRGVRLYGGVDWGEGREEGEVTGGRKKFASWTVLTIGGYVGEQFWPIMMKRYTGKEADPESIIPDILHYAHHYNLEVLGVDWGHGWGVNSRLFKALGKPKVMQFAYSGNLGERKRWDGNAYKFIINRNAALVEIFSAIKQNKMVFPEWEKFEPFAKDILAEYVEYNESTRTMKYDHPIDQPDDALHSLAYCKLAADITQGRF